MSRNFALLSKKGLIGVHSGSEGFIRD